MGYEQEILEGVIKNFANEEQLEGNNIFDVFGIYQVLKKNNINDLELIEESIVDGGADGGIDSMMFFLNEDPILTHEDLENLEITKHSKLDIHITQIKDSAKLKERVFDCLKTTLEDCFNFEKEISNNTYYNPILKSRIFSLKEIIKKVAQKTNNINLFINIIYKGNQISDGVKYKMKSLEDFMNTIEIIPNKKIIVYGVKELRALSLETPEFELELKYSEKMETAFNEDENKLGYILLVSITDYFSLISDEDGKIREHLFESNIRHYMGRSGVNKDIKKTLENEYDIDFWWLNNGVTIITSNIRNSGHKKMALENIQIVNGLQTSHSIHGVISKNANEDSRKVLVKVIQSDTDEVVDNIIRATNSQNEIRISDLKATDKFQRNLEDYFKSCGYYYDRRKNYYKNKGIAQKKIFNITKTAQYMEAFVSKNPSIAKKYPTSLLKKETKYENLFNEKVPIATYLKVCLIGKKIDLLLKNSSLEEFNSKFNTTLKLFNLHIGNIMLALNFKSHLYSANDIKDIDIETIDTDLLEKAINFLSINLEKNIQEYGNLNNIVKSSKLDKSLSKDIKDYFNL